MVVQRANSAPASPPRQDPARAPATRAAAAAAEAANVATWAAVAAQEAAYDAAQAAARRTTTNQPDQPAPARDVPVRRQLRLAPWPPLADPTGLKFWYVREYPGLEDGVYTTEALTNRSVNPTGPRATGLIAGWKTTEPLLRRSYETGKETDTIFWR